MGKVDRNEAPEGYIAKRYLGKKKYTCDDCAFFDQYCTDDMFGCGDNRRKDGQSVIFVKKPDTK